MTKVIADSTCDLSDKLIKKYDIDIIPLYIHMGDKEYKDKVEITPDEIYKWSDENRTTPKTAAPSVEDVIKIIKPYVEQGQDIIIFSISEEMSTTANVMRMAAQTLSYSEHVFVVDSQNLSTGIGLLVIEAAIMAKKNIAARDIVDKIEALKTCVRASFVVDTLVYLHRGGRCSSTSALVGGVLKLKPKIVVQDGKMSADKKYRGKIDKVILEYVKDMEKDLLHAKKDRVFITHSGCPDEVIDKVKEYLKQLNYFKEILVTRAGGVISSHCGPGTLGVLFIAGKEVFGPYDKQFDINHNGIMENDEKIAEEAHIRYVVEKENIDKNEEEESEEE